MLTRFWRDDRAATAIEYCIIAALVSLMIVAGAAAIGTKLATNYYGRVASSLS